MDLLKVAFVDKVQSIFCFIDNDVGANPILHSGPLGGTGAFVARNQVVVSACGVTIPDFPYAIDRAKGVAMDVGNVAGLITDDLVAAGVE